MDEVLNERAAAARRRFEIPILVAALLVVPVIYLEAQTASPGWRQVALVANWLIWLLFLAEYLVVVRLTDDRWGYTKRAWLDVFIIVTSFPGWPALFATTRLLRLLMLGRVLRALRLVRLAAIVGRGGLAAREVLGKRGLGFLLAATLLLWIGASGLFALAEGKGSILDGMWWAIVTISTVGYGDVVPETPVGRGTAAVLMLVGIGFVATLTATVAASFVEHDERKLFDEVRRLHDRLDEIQARLDRDA
jgi:voltage-gated potassium channel